MRFSSSCSPNRPHPRPPVTPTWSSSTARPQRRRLRFTRFDTRHLTSSSSAQSAMIMPTRVNASDQASRVDGTP
jgi:hypothetical protein